MSVENDIKKRINTMKELTKEDVQEIEITQEEAEALGDIRELYGVKLVVVSKLGDKTREDCFAFDKEKRECNALDDLYCENEKCKFYKKKENT